MSKQWVYICIIHTLSFSSFFNWESHRETNFPTIASRDGLSENVSSHNSTAISKTIQCYSYCPSVKHCQGKQVPFSNLFLVRKKKWEWSRWNRHPLLKYKTLPNAWTCFFIFIFRNETVFFFCVKEGSRWRPCCSYRPKEQCTVFTATCPQFCPLV